MSVDKDSNDEVKFSVEILLSEPLEFKLTEIAAAVLEDFPDNAVSVPDYLLEDVVLPKRTQSLNVISTDRPVVGMLQPVDPASGNHIVLTGVGFTDEAFRDADHTELAWRSGAAFGNRAIEIIKTHQSYVTLSITAKDTSLESRFRAARQLNAVTAVFAKLPITLGVLVHWSSHMVAPDAWVKAAQEAQADTWPLGAWLSYRAGYDHAYGETQKMSVGYTTGLANFLDFEFHMEPAPILPTEVLQMLLGAVWLPLEGGSNYRDGDTFGVEDSGLKYLMRRRKNPNGSLRPVMSILHPNSPVDEQSEFGPNPLMKAPEGFDNERRYKSGLMGRLFGKGRVLH